MICVTGAERTLDDLRARLIDNADAKIQEVRLDYLDQQPEPSDLPAELGRLVIACRPLRQGGQFVGTEYQRAQNLLLMLACRPSWIDLELDMNEALRRRLIRAAHQAGTRVLISAHETQRGTETERRDLVDRLLVVNSDAIKLALMIDDAADLAFLREIGESLSCPAVLVGMGEAGTISRVQYQRFGSMWTYVAAEVGRETAPGQITIERMATLQ